MGHSIAIIMDLMGVCTHLTEEKSNSNHMVVASLPPAIPAKTTTTCRVFRAHLPALHSEEMAKEAPLNLTSQIWARTFEAVITISMCPATRSRHPTLCPTNPSCKGQIYN